MNCIECSLNALPVQPAIGYCTHCGAGICVEHVVVEVVNAQPMGMRVSTPRRRRLTCGLCSTTGGSAAVSRWRKKASGVVSEYEFSGRSRR